ncbi:MAG: hypothetical protein ACAI38_02340 [Myxococcota bacterium]
MQEQLPSMGLGDLYNGVDARVYFVDGAKRHIEEVRGGHLSLFQEIDKSDCIVSYVFVEIHSAVLTTSVAKLYIANAIIMWGHG